MFLNDPQDYINDFEEQLREGCKKYKMDGYEWNSWWGGQ